MALSISLDGFNPDGSPHYVVVQTVADGEQPRPVVMTGPVSGPVVTSDGTHYDVSPPFIEVHPDHLAEVADGIGDRHVADGHPDFVRDPEKDSFGFVHVASDGSARISAQAAPDTIEQARAVHGDALTVVEG